MKRTAPLLVSVGCLLLASGCGHDSPSSSSSSSSSPSAPPSSATAPGDPNHGRHAAGLALELDDGKKWPVDEHTRGSAGQMARLVDEATPIETVDEARALGNALDGELDNLIQGCTMTGPAHDQLHVFLGALFPRVKELKSKTDLAGLRETGAQLRLLFEDYERYFQ